MIRKIALILWVTLGLMSNPSWSSRIEYYPCGNESEELLTAVRLVNSPNWDVVTQAVKKIYSLSEKGDWNAFRICCFFKKDGGPDFDEYIPNIYNHLLSNQNFSAMGRYGSILFDLKKLKHALRFLRTAIKNQAQYKHSVKILEYKYMDNVIQIDPQDLGEHSKILKFHRQVWDISKKHIAVRSIDFREQFFKFFKRLKLLNFERLINEIGHYLIVNDERYLEIYSEVFQNTIHLDRFYRQRGLVCIKTDNGSAKSEAIVEAMDAKELRELNFIKSARQSVKQGAIQAINKLLTHNADTQQALKNFGASYLNQLSSEQKNTMALFLLAIYPKRIFCGELMDNEEYIDRFLSSNTNKFKFLIQEVFGAI